MYLPQAHEGEPISVLMSSQRTDAFPQLDPEDLSLGLLAVRTPINSIK